MLCIGAQQKSSNEEEQEHFSLIMEIKKMDFSKKSLPLACGISEWLLCCSHLG